MKQIKGTIEYTITIGEGYSEVEYNSTIDNDIAGLIIAHRVIDTYEEKFRVDKKGATGGFKKSISQYLDKCVKAKFALVSMFNYAYGVYEEYHNHVDKKVKQATETLQNLQEKDKE